MLQMTIISDPSIVIKCRRCTDLKGEGLSIFHWILTVLEGGSKTSKLVLIKQH